ncbi:hypothetical protein [Lacisediminihabitans sp.]|jgi:hypothetical protein|uniref:hypothetical protein n=1 Tax=Lacisediminihabitans sp. TaxID=2787631 RepID=UPI0039C8FD63
MNLAFMPKMTCPYGRDIPIVDAGRSTLNLLPPTRGAFVWINRAAFMPSAGSEVGHASAAMTLDVYADLFDDDLDAVAVALNDSAAAATGKVRANPPGAATS